MSAVDEMYGDPDLKARAENIKKTVRKLSFNGEFFEDNAVRNENGELVKLLEIYTKTLPEADRRLLREGIRITSIDALDALIEDYTS